MFTDKLVAPIPSSFHGKVHKIYYKENEQCLVGKVLCDIEVEDTATSKGSDTKKNVSNQDKKVSSSSKPASSSSSSSSDDEKNVKSSSNESNYDKSNYTTIS